MSPIEYLFFSKKVTLIEYMKQGLKSDARPPVWLCVETHKEYNDDSLFRFAWSTLSKNDYSVTLRKKDYISQKYDLKFLHLLHITPKINLTIQNSIYQLIAYHDVCWFNSNNKFFVTTAILK